jgi:fructokinase
MAETQAPLIIGIELGGTKCVATLASGPGDIRAQRSVPSEAPAITLPAIAAIVHEWVAADPAIAALGIASFGPIAVSPTDSRFGHMLATPKPGWAGADVLGGIKAGAPHLPVALDTDVAGAALAERRWGAARGLDDFAYVTVGTGVGVGLIVNGAPSRGFLHSEMGHLRVPRLPGDVWPSSCPFHADCVEGLASGSAIALVARELDMAIEDIPADHPLWERVAFTIAQLGHALAVSLGPRLVAVGGGVVNRQPHLLDRANALLVESLAGYLDLPAMPYLVPPGLGDQAGPMGPIAMGLESETKPFI